MPVQRFDIPSGDGIVKLTGRSISKGKGQGTALLLSAPFSFLGGVDTKTSRLTVSSGREGEEIKGKVFAFQRGKGSTVGSYTIYDLKKYGNLPAAIINEKAETIVATGAVMAGVPMVDQIDLSLLKDGDDIVVDGNDGTVEVLNVKESSVITCVIRHKDEILLLKRSEKVSTNKLKWAGVSGYIESGDTPLETAYKEMSEEVKQNDPKLVQILPVISLRETDHVWRIHPFLFDTEQTDVEIDWEHTEYKWVRTNELDSYDLVPGFKKLVADLKL